MVIIDCLLISVQRDSTLEILSWNCSLSGGGGQPESCFNSVGVDMIKEVHGRNSAQRKEICVVLINQRSINGKASTLTADKWVFLLT